MRQEEFITSEKRRLSTRQWNAVTHLLKKYKRAAAKIPSSAGKRS